MDNNISFIPKKPIAKNEFARRRPLFSYSFFIALVIALFAMAFAIKNYIELDQANEELALAKSNLVAYSQQFSGGFNKDIQDIKILSQQIAIAEGLLERHVAVSNLFEYIGKITPSNVVGSKSNRKIVSFSNFSYKKDADSIQISMSGEASEYAVLAAFSRALKERSDVIKSYRITGVALTTKGTVQFAFSATLDTGLVSYKKKTVRTEGSSSNTNETTPTGSSSVPNFSPKKTSTQ